MLDEQVSLVVMPARLLFGELFPGERARLTTFVVNTGGSELIVSRMVVTRGLSGEIRDQRFVAGSIDGVIPPGEALPVAIDFVAPAEPTEALARLRVFFREPSAPVPEVLLTGSVISPPAAGEAPLPRLGVAASSPWRIDPEGRRAERWVTIEVPPSAPTSSRADLAWEVVRSAPAAVTVEPQAGVVSLGRRELRSLRVALAYPPPSGERRLELGTTVRDEEGTVGTPLAPLVLDSLLRVPPSVPEGSACGAGTSGPTILEELSVPVPNPYPPEGASPLQDPFGTLALRIETLGTPMGCDEDAGDPPRLRFDLELDSRVGGRNNATASFLFRWASCGRLGLTTGGVTNGIADSVASGGAPRSGCAGRPGDAHDEPASLALSRVDTLAAGVRADGTSTCAVRGPSVTRLLLGQRGVAVSPSSGPPGSDSENTVGERLVVEVHWETSTDGSGCEVGRIEIEGVRTVFLTGRSVFNPRSRRWVRTTGDADGDGVSNYAEVLAAAGTPASV